ncbi:AMP-binding protein [Nocardia uniformis]|uniref:AMP-binding protein n=1 Tax=Nocardia uniformis TaxID=53432 RepID=A0A849CCR7_9NOCA|nr:AMP-binding protein [Nocardia uniformis]NNH72849.1 AMP-binding protein [Nocardia uniformis]
MCKPIESSATLVALRPSAAEPLAAQNDPAAIATATADCELSYAELDRWSNRMARMLLRLGAHPGARVAIVGTPQLEAMVARSAIAKTGATPAPLGSTDTIARADFVVTTKEGRERLPQILRADTATRWLVLDERSTLVQYLTGSDAPITDAERQTARMAS